MKDDFVNNYALAGKIAFDKNATYIGENEFSKAELVEQNGKKYVVLEKDLFENSQKDFESNQALNSIISKRKVNVPKIYGSREDHVLNKIYVVRDYVDGEVMFYRNFEQYKKTHKDATQQQFVEDYYARLNKLINLDKAHLFKLTKDIIRTVALGVEINNTGDYYILSNNGIYLIDIGGTEIHPQNLTLSDALKMGMNGVANIMYNAYASVTPFVSEKELEHIKEQNAVFFSKYADALICHQKEIGGVPNKLIRNFYNENETIKDIVGDMLHNYDLETVDGWEM